MGDRYDVIVAGLGAVGSATTYHLAKRGRRVLGIDRYPPGHTHGSSHGDSRIIRELYFEHPLYVPLVQRAYDLWSELESESGANLMSITGGVMCGAPGSQVARGARASATTYGIPFETLDADELHRRVPPFQVPEDFVTVWDARAGFVRPEACVRAHLDLAARDGARVVFGEQLLAWEATGEGVSVTTSAGAYQADHLVLSLGAWMAQYLPELKLPLAVERQVLLWFDPPAAPDAFAPERFPIYLCEHELGRTIYGFPRLAKGVKAGIFHEGAHVQDPDVPRLPVGDADVAALRGILARILPGLAAAPVRASTTCLFSNTPDTRFVIGRHPMHAQVVLCSSCSGHGFKFASAIGEANADLVTQRSPRTDLSPFSPGRFLTTSAA